MADDVPQSAYLPSNDEGLVQFIQVVRMVMRDYPELNRLIRGEEHSDRLIAWAILDVIDDWNTTPPLIGPVTISSFPSAHLLVQGTVVSLLKSAGLLMTRNAIAFSDGGFSYNTDKTAALMAWIQLHDNEYEKKKLRLKTATNIARAWGGGLHSEYLWISSGWYGSWI
jgi:hypothetical protein